MRKLLYLKVAELLDHQIAFHQHVYKDDDHKFSEYLACYPLTKNQRITMNH